MTEKTTVTYNKEIPSSSPKDASLLQIRGSSLLLSGKFISVGINLITQILIVRYLSKADFGAWSYTLVVVAFFEAFATLGLKRSITRFIPIYHEKEEYDKLFGTIFLVLIVIIGTGIIFTALVYLSPELISKLVSGDNGYPVQLLLIMIFLVPIQAIDITLVSLFASFSSTKNIFFRKFILGPGLKLVVVLSLLLVQSSVFFLAYGYLIASALGILIYFWVLFRLLSEKGISKQFHLKKIHIPAKEIFSFTIPLLSSDLVATVMHTSDTLLLGYFHNSTEVASYTVILPAAHLNKIVMTSFSLLYTPLCARLFAKKDYAGINNLYWCTAIWMGILSFPVFLLTFSLSNPLTSFLYGQRYEDSYILLQLLSLGYYFNCILGFNGLTLKVLGKVRYVFIINILAAILNVILNIILIPRYGALGAAIATAGAMVCHNIFKQIGLRLASGIQLFHWEYLSYYLLTSSSAIGLFLLSSFFLSNIYISIVIAAIVSLIIFRISEKNLELEQVFPEIYKISILKFLFSSNKR